MNILSFSIDKLRDLLEEGNFVELTYILGNRKEIIKRNSKLNEKLMSSLK